MKKILLILMFLILLSFVNSLDSTDRTDYYFNGTFFMVDGIDSQDLTIFNTTPSNLDALVTGGCIKYS